MKTAWTVFCFFLSLPAFALDFPPTTLVQQESYQCSQHGGGFAIKLSEPRRVWQVEDFSAGEKTVGLELQNLEFQLARCPDCFRFQGELAGMGQALKYDGSVERDVSGKIQLTLRLSEDGHSQAQTLRMPCVRVAD